MSALRKDEPVYEYRPADCPHHDTIQGLIAAAGWLQRNPGVPQATVIIHIGQDSSLSADELARTKAAMSTLPWWKQDVRAEGDLVALHGSLNHRVGVHAFRSVLPVTTDDFVSGDGSEVETPW